MVKTELSMEEEDSVKKKLNLNQTKMPLSITTHAKKLIPEYLSITMYPSILAGSFTKNLNSTFYS